MKYFIKSPSLSWPLVKFFPNNGGKDGIRGNDKI